MSWPDWAVALVLVLAVLLGWALVLRGKYKYARTCPVKWWSRPLQECFRCPHLEDCPRAQDSPSVREWWCPPEELEELERMIAERRDELDGSGDG